MANIQNCPECGGTHFGSRSNYCPINDKTITLSTGATVTFEKELDVRSKVFAFEDVIKASGKQIELEVKHYFSYGVYARELHIPKGVILTGHIHKYANLNIISKGALEVLVGDEIQLIKAPYTIVSPPGTKRIARAIEDTVWTTIHGTNEVDVDKIEDYFIAKTEQEFLEFIKQQPELPFTQTLVFEDERVSK